MTENHTRTLDAKIERVGIYITLTDLDNTSILPFPLPPLPPSQRVWGGVLHLRRPLPPPDPSTAPLTSRLHPLLVCTPSFSVEPPRLPFFCT
jgi:hypothetical protein